MSSLPKKAADSLQNLASIGQVVSEEMFENSANIHVYSPGARADTPLGSIVFQKHESSINFVISTSCFPLNDVVTPCEN